MLHRRKGDLKLVWVMIWTLNDQVDTGLYLIRSLDLTHINRHGKAVRYEFFFFFFFSKAFSSTIGAA